MRSSLVPASTTALALALAAGPAAAEPSRDLSTDRPDTTESPYTVEPGHVQVESDLVTATFVDDTTDVSALAFNLKLGVHRRVDVQLLVEPIRHLRAAGASTTGFGDTTARVKVNLWGNDGGATAACLMPYVTAPTASNGLGIAGVEGGLIAVIGADAPHDVGVAAMVEGALVRDDAGDLAPALLLTATAGRELAGPLAGFVEVAVPIEDGDVGVEAHGGVTYAVGRNAQLDAGVNVELTGSNAITPFLGASFRR
jgi:hypothetical protein